MDKCVHDINKDNHSIHILPVRFMISPETIHGICCVCHKSLTFIREEDSDNFSLKEVYDENGTRDV